MGCEPGPKPEHPGAERAGTRMGADGNPENRRAEGRERSFLGQPGAGEDGDSVRGGGPGDERGAGQIGGAERWQYDRLTQTSF